MSDFKLKTEKREPKEKKQGCIPAILYGPKTENMPLFVDLNDFKKVWEQAGESTVIELESTYDVDSNIPALIQDVDMHPLRHEPQHVDFYAVDMTKKTIVSVPLVFSGEAPAVKTLGGVLIKVIQEVEVEALPSDLPSELKVDISALKTFEDRITVADLSAFGGKAKILAEQDEVIALVEPVKEESFDEIQEKEDISIEDIEATKEKPKEEEEDAGGKEKAEDKDENQKQN